MHNRSAKDFFLILESGIKYCYYDTKYCQFANIFNIAAELVTSGGDI